MFIEVLGGALVIMSGSFLGCIFSNDLNKRLEELRTLQTMLMMFENEISFMSSVLKVAFQRIYLSTSSKITYFFKETVDILTNNGGVTASEAFEIAVKNNIKNTALDKEDEEILIAFGKMLGQSDIEGQVNNIRTTLARLNVQEKKAEEKIKRNGVMYRSLGTLFGIAIVLILL